MKLSEKSKKSLNFIYALFKKPIYINCDYKDDGTVKAAKDFKPVIKVAIVGFNESGQTFLDTLLQVGQMPGRSLNVTVYSHNIETEKAEYLSKRPAFTEFFDVDDMHSEDSYGHITFKNSIWSNLSETTVAYFNELDKMDYVLFAEDKKGAVSDKVGAILKENPLSEKPFLIKAQYYEDMTNITDREEFAELERMAFNTHLVWKYTLECDFDKAEKEFNKEYNFISSLSYALSVKYKLHSLGIELDMNDVKATAGTFISVVDSADSGSNKNIKNIDLLSYAEHRRWNAEKVCSGWQRIELKDITTDDNHNKGKTEDNFKNHHYCLVKSHLGNPLASWSPDDWDKMPIDELDELDKVSVVTHRVLNEEINNTLLSSFENSKNEFLVENIIQEELIIYLCKNAKPEYKDWKACVELIFRSNAKKVCKPYENAYNRLIKKIDNTKIKGEIEKVNETISLLIASRNPDNQKDKDYYLVKRIPFILLYKKDLRLACEFTAGDNSKLFTNVGILKKYNPKEITFFCEYSNSLEADIKHFLDCIKDYKWLRTGINFVLGSSSNGEKNKVNNLIADYELLNVKSYPYDSYYDYVSCVGDDKISDDNDVVIYKNKTLGYNLRKAGVSCGSCSVSKDGKLIGSGDLLLRSVNFDIAMTIQDILRINGAEGTKENVPVVFENIYPVYRDNKLAWKTFCKWLVDYNFFKDVKIDGVIYKNKNKRTFEVDSNKRKNLTKRLNKAAENSFYYDSDKTEKEIAKEKLTKSFYNMLALLEKIGMLSVFYTNNEIEKISFTSLKNKFLFDQEGKMLEAHIYNRCVFSGYFDDVATGYEIKWEKTDNNVIVCNEFDLLLVKGLKSAFVEIKATADVAGSTGLRQEYYEKLEALDCKFGINSHEFIVNDCVKKVEFTDKNGRKYKSFIDGDKIQIERGKQFGIKTILPKDDIEKVADIINEAF